VDVFSALADPTRRSIVALLASGERNAGDLARQFSIAVPSVSRHLRVLREARLVSSRARAQERIYRLEPAALAEARSWMDAQLQRLQSQFDALGEHLDHMKERGD
jgi:DNA-binding transcriptional ArsR family regulator